MVRIEADNFKSRVIDDKHIAIDLQTAFYDSDEKRVPGISFVVKSAAAKTAGISTPERGYYDIKDLIVDDGSLSLEDAKEFKVSVAATYLEGNLQKEVIQDISFDISQQVKELLDIKQAKKQRKDQEDRQRAEEAKKTAAEKERKRREQEAYAATAPEKKAKLRTEIIEAGRKIIESKQFQIEPFNTFKEFADDPTTKDVVLRVAHEAPARLLQAAGTLRFASWAFDALRIAAKLEPEAAISIIENINDMDWAHDILRLAVDGFEKKAINALIHYNKTPWCEEFMNDLARNAPQAVLETALIWQDYPWAERIATTASKKVSPDVFARCFDLFKHQAWAKKLHSIVDQSRRNTGAEDAERKRLLKLKLLAAAKEINDPDSQNNRKNFALLYANHSNENVKKIMLELANTAKQACIDHIAIYKSAPWAGQVVMKVLDNKSDNAIVVLEGIKDYVEMPWAKDIVECASKLQPAMALRLLPKYAGESWAKPIVLQIQYQNPEILYEEFDYVENQPWVDEILLEAKPEHRSLVHALLNRNSHLSWIIRVKEKLLALEEKERDEEEVRERARLNRIAKEKAIREKAAQDEAARAKEAKEKAERKKQEQYERERPERERVATEKAERKKVADEDAARAKAAREKADREKAAQDEAARVKAAEDARIKKTEDAAREAEIARITHEKSKKRVRRFLGGVALLASLTGGYFLVSKLRKDAEIQRVIETREAAEKEAARIAAEKAAKEAAEKEAARIAAENRAADLVQRMKNFEVSSDILAAFRSLALENNKLAVVPKLDNLYMFKGENGACTLRITTGQLEPAIIDLLKSISIPGVTIDRSNEHLNDSITYNFNTAQGLNPSTKELIYLLEEFAKAKRGSWSNFSISTNPPIVKYSKSYLERLSFGSFNAIFPQISNLLGKDNDSVYLLKDPLFARDLLAFERSLKGAEKELEDLAKNIGYSEMQSIFSSIKSVPELEVQLVNIPKIKLRYSITGLESTSVKSDTISGIATKFSGNRMPSNTPCTGNVVFNARNYHPNSYSSYDKRYIDEEVCCTVSPHPSGGFKFDNFHRRIRGTSVSEWGEWNQSDINEYRRSLEGSFLEYIKDTCKSNAFIGTCTTYDSDDVFTIKIDGTKNADVLFRFISENLKKQNSEYTVIKIGTDTIEIKWQSEGKLPVVFKLSVLNSSLVRTNLLSVDGSPIHENIANDAPWMNSFRNMVKNDLESMINQKIKIGLVEGPVK